MPSSRSSYTSAYGRRDLSSSTYGSSASRLRTSEISSRERESTVRIPSTTTDRYGLSNRRNLTGSSRLSSNATSNMTYGSSSRCAVLMPLFAGSTSVPFTISHPLRSPQAAIKRVRGYAIFPFLQDLSDAEDQLRQQLHKPITEPRGSHPASYFVPLPHPETSPVRQARPAKPSPEDLAKINVHPKGTCDRC